MPFFLFKSRLRVINALTVCAVTGYLIAVMSTSASWYEGLYLIPAWILLSAGTYILNDVTDISIDETNEATRPIVAGKVSKKEASIVSFSFLSLSLLFSLPFGNQYFLFYGLCLFLGVTYSLPPLHFKKRIMGKQLTLGLGVVLSLLAGGSALGVFPSVLVYAVILISPFMFICSVIADLKDTEGDAKAQCRTMAISLGAKKTLDLAIFGMGLMFFFILLGYLYFGLGPLFLILALGLAGVNLWQYLDYRKSDVQMREYKKLVKLHKVSVPIFQFSVLFGLVL